MEEAKLNVTDIKDAVLIIDAAAEHGIFKGWNAIRRVLMVRDRLDAFATAVTEQVGSPEDQSPAEQMSPTA